MVNCAGMGDDINNKDCQYARDVLEFMMTFGICPKDLKRVKNICESTPPSAWGDVCEWYNGLDDAAKQMITDFIENMEDQHFSLKPHATKPLVGYKLKPGVVTVSKKVPVKKALKKPKIGVRKK
jgi:hypothetical protein